MKILFLLFILLFGFIGFCQSPSDKIDLNNFNKKYVEHLIKIKIDSVRKTNNCKPLINDSILYVAANHHANYMVENNRLSHFENETAVTKTPQSRAGFFGAVNYMVGENVLKTTANTAIKSKKGKILDTGTYGGLATSIIVGWVNSPGHFENIITPDYQITGVSVAIKDGKVFACQKFAEVLYKYEFKEPADFFSYSNYTPDPIVSSFKSIKRGLIPYEYEWKLRHDKLEKCAECLELTKVKPFITLRYEENRGDFILRIENSEYIQKLMQNKKDGFAVEIVEYNDYACGNPAYYTKPSRRNGQLTTNGIILKPLFRDDLIKGFKKRKKKKEVRFLSYLFGADSVKFKNRFSTYKSAQYTSEYYEIKLGRLPKDIKGLWAHNLIYIQENQICKIDYFTGYCGDLFMDTIKMDFIPLDTIGANYTFENEERTEQIEIPFEQNKFTYSKKDIAPFIQSLKGVNYSIDSIYIISYASVEGDSATNQNLQQKRAESIVNTLQENQLKKIPARIKTETAWSHFYSKIRVHPTYRKLASLSKDEIRIALQDQTTLKELETILKAERKAMINLYISVAPSEKNMPYLIKKEWKDLTNEYTENKKDPNSANIYLNKINQLYEFAHKKVVAGSIDTTILSEMEFPEIYLKSIDLRLNFLLYGHEFKEAYKKNKQWMSHHNKLREEFSKTGNANFSPFFIYNNAYWNTKQILSGKKTDQETIQSIIDQLKMIQTFYFSHPNAKKNIDAMNFNLNMLLLNTVFPTNPEEASADARIALSQIALYYINEHENPQIRDANLSLSLANMAIFYMNIDQAIAITTNYMEDGEVLKCIVPLGYDHPSNPLMSQYYDYLIELSKTTTDSVWCNLFMNECAIPFQAFDHAPLRTIFCQKWQDENDYLNNLQNQN